MGKAGQQQASNASGSMSMRETRTECDLIHGEVAMRWSTGFGNGRGQPANRSSASEQSPLPEAEDASWPASGKWNGEPLLVPSLYHTQTPYLLHTPPHFPTGRRRHNLTGTHYILLLPLFFSPLVLKSKTQGAYMGCESSDPTPVLHI